MVNMTKNTDYIRNIGASVRGLAIHVARKLRPITMGAPVSILMVISLVSIAITAEAALFKTTNSREVVMTSQTLQRAQARLSRSSAMFDVKRGAAVAISPMVIMGVDSSSADEAASKPAECLLKEMTESLRCQ